MKMKKMETKIRVLRVKFGSALDFG
jgi:hypothetical protein